MRTFPYLCFTSLLIHIIADIIDAVLRWVTAGGYAFSSILLHW